MLSYGGVARWRDQAMGVPQHAEGRGALSPALHAFGRFANALLIPVSMGSQRWLDGVPLRVPPLGVLPLRFELLARARSSSCPPSWS